MNYPYLKFYVRDWTGDQQLRLVSLSARGLWLECICMMHNALRYGYLETATGQKIDDDTLSRLIGTNKDDLYRFKDELINAGIPSVEDTTGIWYSRRMVKEKAKADKCSNAGKKGGGNPSLVSHPNTNKVIQIPETRNHISLKVTFKGDVYTSIFEAFWKHYPKKVGKPQAEKAMVKALKRESQEAILQGFEKHIEGWKKTEKRFIPNPATWLNRDGWNDEVIEHTEQLPIKKERHIWEQCAERCRFWDEDKRWCTRHEQTEPRTPDVCRHFN